METLLFFATLARMTGTRSGKMESVLIGFPNNYFFLGLPGTTLPLFIIIYQQHKFHIIPATGTKHPPPPPLPLVSRNMQHAGKIT